MKKVCVVILNWNGRDLTLRCLQDLRKSEYPELACVVVDNGSTDGSPEAIAKAYPETGIIRNATNLGWAVGSNQGIVWGLERGADYLLMLNNDAWGDPAMISSLVGTASDLHDQAAVIPKIYLGNDCTRFWFARGRVNFWTGLFTNPAYNLVDDGRFDFSPEVEYASGCCILIPRGIVQRVGGFDASFFSYVEDVDWSIRCRRAGFRIVLCPTAKLWHEVSVTGKRQPATMRYLLTRNNLWALRRYASPWQFASAMLLLPLRSIWRISKVLRAHDWKSVRAEVRGLKDGLLGAVGPESSAGKL
jgi:GT2 family glycosyltransferase